MTVDIKEVLDLIVQMNINRCAATTFDLGIQECARQEIVQGLARHYDIQYHITRPTVQIFPARGSHA